MSLLTGETAEIAAEVPSEGGRSREVFERLVHNPSAVIGAVLILAFVLVAIFAPFLAPHSPTDSRWFDQIRPGYAPGPSAEHWLGLDFQGRDELSRIIYGARTSLVIGIGSLVFGMVAGLLIGGVAGAFGGWVDNLLMRIVDILLSVPGLLLAIGVAALLGRSMWAIIIAIAVANVPAFARLLRGSMLGERERDYVLAATAVGVKRWRIVLQHVVPNSIAPIIVQGTLAMATAIIDAAGLAFLGLGSADPGVPEWGRMLTETARYFDSAPQLAFFPGAAILFSVLGFNMLGDALREALDPKLRRS